MRTNFRNCQVLPRPDAAAESRPPVATWNASNFLLCDVRLNNKPVRHHFVTVEVTHRACTSRRAEQNIRRTRRCGVCLSNTSPSRRKCFACVERSVVLCACSVQCTKKKNLITSRVCCMLPIVSRQLDERNSKRRAKSLASKSQRSSFLYSYQIHFVRLLFSQSIRWDNQIVKHALYRFWIRFRRLKQ